MSSFKIALEGSKAYEEIPSVHDSQGKMYAIESVTDDGGLTYRSLDSTFDVEPDLDFREIIQEGIANGIFAGDRNPQGSVLRCEAIFELWRSLGGVSEYVEYEPSRVSRVERQVDDLCGEEAYYRSAVQWFLTNGKSNSENMYSYRDLEMPLTWLELGYWLYFILRGQSKIAVGDIPTDESLGLSVITTVKKGQEALDTKFSSYKTTRWMKSYLTSIREGSRYVPFPVYYSFMNMKNEGILPVTSTHVINGELRVTGEDPESNSWILKEVSLEDLKSNMKNIISLLEDVKG